MILTIFCVFLCLSDGLSDSFESVRGKSTSSTVLSTPSPLLPPASSSSTSTSALSPSSRNKASPLLTSANNWYPAQLVLTTTAPPNASNIDDWVDHQADPTVVAETRVSESGDLNDDELCLLDHTNLNGNSLEERNKTAVRVASNCRTAVLQKPSIVKFYGEKIKPSTSAFKNEKRNNLTNNFISPHSINAKTSPNGEITVINGKSVTGILYAHQHSLIVPQFEKLTAPGKNYIVTKTGNEDTAASENKTDTADNDEGEESGEGDEKDGNEKAVTDKISENNKTEATEKVLDAGNNIKHHSEKDSEHDDDDDAEEDNGGKDSNQYSPPSPSSPPSTTTTTSVPHSRPPSSSTSTVKAYTTTSTPSTTTRPTKIRFPPRRPDYVSKAKYGDKLDKSSVQTPSLAGKTESTTTTTTTRPKLPTQSGTRRPALSLMPSTTTAAYSRHSASVPKKMNSQIEALRNRYKSNNKVSAGRVSSSSGEAYPPAVLPTATPNKVTVEYTTTTTTTAESPPLKYELDHSSDLKPGNNEATKSKNTMHNLNNDKRIIKQFKEKENKSDFEFGNPTKTPPNEHTHHNAASLDKSTKKQTLEPINIHYQKETHKSNNMATTARPRGLNRWTNYRHTSTPDYRYVSTPSSPTPFPVKMSLPQNAYYTPVPAVGQNHYHNSQNHHSAPDNHQSFLPTYFDNSFPHQDFASTVQPFLTVSPTSPKQQHYTTVPPSHSPESVSDYHFSNYFVQNQPQKKHTIFQHSPSTTLSPEVFVTIENQFIVLRNQTPIMQKEILLPVFPETNHQPQHNHNKFNNALFDLPFNKKEQQFKIKQQQVFENLEKPFTVSNYNEHRYNSMENHRYSENNRHLKTPVSLSQLSSTKTPAEMVFYYEQNSKPRLNYRLVHSPSNQEEESTQTPTSSLSLFDRFNSPNRQHSNTIPLSQPSISPGRKHLSPKMNMFKPIDITPNKGMSIILNDHMLSTKKLNHVVQSDLSTPLSTPKTIHPEHKKVKPTSVSYLISPVKSEAITSSYNKNPDNSGDDSSKYTVVRHYVRTLDYDDNRIHRPSTLEFDNHLNIANLKEGSRIPSVSSHNSVPSTSSLSQYFGLPRSKSQITLNDDEKGEQYHTRLRIIEPTLVAKPTPAIMFNFNVPSGTASTRQAQPSPPQTQSAESYKVNLRDVSLLTNLKRPTPSQPSQTTIPGFQHLPLIASQPTSNPDLSALFMSHSNLFDSRPNVVPVETTIFETEPLNAENSVLTESVGKTPIFSVDSTSASRSLPFQTYTSVKQTDAVGKQQEMSTQAQNKKLFNVDMFHPKLKQNAPQDIMDEGIADSKIHELMKPSVDPFEEYYSDRILPLNAMIDYSGVVWNAENSENNRVNLLRPNTTQSSGNRPSLSNDHVVAGESKHTVKSKLKDLLLMLNEVRAGNQSQQQQQQHLNNQIKAKTTLESEPSESAKSIFEQTQLVPVFSNNADNFNLQNDGSKNQEKTVKNFEESMTPSMQQSTGQKQPLLLWHLKPSASPSEIPSTAQPSADFKFRRNQRILNSLKTIFGLSNPQINLPVLNNAARLYS